MFRIHIRTLRMVGHALEEWCFQGVWSSGFREGLSRHFTSLGIGFRDSRQQKKGSQAGFGSRFRLQVSVSWPRTLDPLGDDHPRS